MAITIDKEYDETTLDASVKILSSTGIQSQS